MLSPHGPAEHKLLLQKHTSPSKPNPLVLVNLPRISAASLPSFIQPSPDNGLGRQERATVMDFAKTAMEYIVLLYVKQKHHTAAMAYWGILYGCPLLRCACYWYIYLTGVGLVFVGCRSPAIWTTALGFLKVGNFGSAILMSYVFTVFTSFTDMFIPGHPIWTTYLSFMNVDNFGSAFAHLPAWIFFPLDFLEYLIEHVSIGIFYIKCIFSIRIFYRGVPGLATDCSCGVWCRGFTTCLLYVCSRFGNKFWMTDGL